MRTLRLPLLMLAALASLSPITGDTYVTTSTSSSGFNTPALDEAFKGLQADDFDLEEFTKQMNGQSVYSQTGQQDPLEVLSSLKSTDKETQIAFLESFGETISEEAGIGCNIYGGKESCVQLSSDTEFARLCPDHDLKVDCAFSVMATQEAQLDPVRDIKRALEAAKEQDIEADCPECFSNQLQWFCASLFPKCGSVRASMETQMVPIIAEIIKVENEGKDVGEALADVLPTVLKARSLTLPCKQMCLDVMDTCACGQRKTMGQLLETYSDSQTGEPLPAAFSMSLFKGVWNTSFCDLFSPEDAPGFAGTCQPMAKQCSDREGWCQPGNPVPGVAAEIMAGQLADSLFGQMNSFESGRSAAAAVTRAANTPEGKNQYHVEYTNPSSSSKGSTGKGVVIGVTCTAAIAAVSFGTAYWWLAVRKRRSEEEEDGIAMTENDALLPRTES